MISYAHHALLWGQLVKPAERILLTITSHPDGDSVGAMLATALALRHLEKPAACYSPDPIPAMFGFLRDAHPVMHDLPASIDEHELIIIFDTGDIKRTPLVEDFVKRRTPRTKILNIDHHPTVTAWRKRSAVDHNIIDTAAGSTTEMLYHLFTELRIPLTPDMATCLLTGILTDTGHFSNNGTSLESLDVAAKLMASGGAHHTITQATMRNKTMGTLKLWGRALSRLKLNPDSGIVTTVLTLKDFQDCQVTREASTGISNFLNSLGEGRMSMLLTEEPGGKIKGGLRTTRPNVNVADFAAQFGGGGHPKAAGFVVSGKLVEGKDGWRVEPLSPPHS